MLAYRVILTYQGNAYGLHGESTGPPFLCTQESPIEPPETPGATAALQATSSTLSPTVAPSTITTSSPPPTPTYSPVPVPTATDSRLVDPASRSPASSSMVRSSGTSPTSTPRSSTWAPQDGRALDGTSDGRPRFVFPSRVLEPGPVVRVSTDQDHPAMGGLSLGSGSAIWNNSDADEAGLFYSAGGLA